MNDKSQRRSMRFCVAFALLVVATLLSVFVNYRFIDPRLVREPYKLSVYDYQNKTPLLLEKTDALCQELLREAYCRDYYDCIMRQDVSLSSYKMEVALPNVQAQGKVYMLKENAALRYELWKKAPPQVVLLGSSWMFQGFNRRKFFERYPQLRMLDFTVCSNTPDTTQFYLQQLAAHDCEVPAGTVFLYGINVVELVPWYQGNIPGYAQDTLAPTPNRLRRELDVIQLGVNDLRDKARTKLKATFVPPPDNANVRPYVFEIPEEHVGDPVKLKDWLCRLEPLRTTPNVITAGFSKQRLDALRWIAKWVEAHQGKLVLIKLPTSTLSQNVCVELHQSFDLQIGDVVKQLGISYFDLSVHQTTDIHDGHFVYPGNLFNPDHLNYEGAMVLTSYLLQELHDGWLAPLVSACSEKSGERRMAKK